MDFVAPIKTFPNEVGGVLLDEVHVFSPVKDSEFHIFVQDPFLAQTWKQKHELYSFFVY